MSEHVEVTRADVTRADREAAALVWCGPEGAKKPRSVAFIERGEPMAWSLDEIAAAIARVRIAAERAGYARGAREERERVVAMLRVETDADPAIADHIACGVHAKEGA